MADHSEPKKRRGKPKKNTQQKILVSLEEYKRRLGSANLKVFSIIGAILVSLGVGISVLFNNRTQDAVVPPLPAMAASSAFMTPVPSSAAWGVGTSSTAAPLMSFVCQSCGLSGIAKHVAGVGLPHPMCPNCGAIMTHVGSITQPMMSQGMVNQGMGMQPMAMQQINEGGRNMNNAGMGIQTVAMGTQPMVMEIVGEGMGNMNRMNANGMLGGDGMSGMNNVAMALSPDAMMLDRGMQQVALLANLMGNSAPPINCNSGMPHGWRGNCTACHQVQSWPCAQGTPVALLMSQGGMNNAAMGSMNPNRMGDDG